MTDRRRFDGLRQRAVLRKLRLRAGKDLTVLAQEVGLSYPQLLRYATGKAPLRSDHLLVFAEAFGVSPVDLAVELAGQDVFDAPEADEPADDWAFRAALRGRIPESLIDELAPRWERESVVNQQAAVEGILHLAEIERSARTRRDNPTTTRLLAGQ